MSQRRLQEMKIVTLITARGSSKGLPRKNVLPLAGKPLIAWTIEAALKSRRLNRVIVSTDDEEIAQVARQWGADVPFLRPAELAQDASPHIDVVNHAIQWLEENEKQFPEYVMLLQPTSPFRTAQDIDQAIEIAKTHQAVAVVSVCEASEHPFLSKKISPDGTLDDFVVLNRAAYLRRQDLPPAYALNGAIYLNRRESLLCDQTFLPYGTLAYVMPTERSLDIDTPWEWHLAELILKDQHEHA